MPFDQNFLNILPVNLGETPTIEALGDDAVIGMILRCKEVTAILTMEAQEFRFRNLGAGDLEHTLSVQSVVNGINYLLVKNSSLSQAIPIQAIGTDTNIHINVIPKGTGALQVNGNAVAVGQFARSLFGDGSGGDVTSVGNLTLTRHQYFNNYTIDNGHTITTNGFRLHVKNTLTINGSGILNANGSAGASGATGGAGGSNNSDGGSEIAANAGSTGGAGGATNGSNSTNMTVGYRLVSSTALANGGAGGNGSLGNGGVGNAPATNTYMPKFAVPFWIAASNGSPTFCGMSGQGGGGGGGDGVAGGQGGGGGGGGGLIYIAAKTIVNNGTIQTNGGIGGEGEPKVAGNRGGGGGGGGGSGGLVYLVYEALTAGTISHTGGTGGADGTGSGTGTAGGAGVNGNAGLTLKYNCLTGAFE